MNWLMVEMFQECCIYMQEEFLAIQKVHMTSESALLDASFHDATCCV